MVVLKAFRFCGCILAVVGLDFLMFPFLWWYILVVFGMLFLQFLRFVFVGLVLAVFFTFHNAFSI